MLSPLFMETTFRSTGFLTGRLLTHCKSVCRSALTKSSSGWCLTSCSLTLPRLRCSDVHPLNVSISSRLSLFVLVTNLCCRYEQFETCGSILTQTFPWVLTSLQSSKRVLLHSVKFAALARCWHLTLVHALACGHKGGLLQLSSLGGHFRITVTMAAVCHQCRRSSRVLGEEVRAHNSTPPWTTLAESSQRIQFRLCSRIPLP